MTYPIKFIEDNLVFNQANECFAYYELIPYNYSFLSLEEKSQLRHHLRQLVTQNGEGALHALEIATESSIREVQSQAKQMIQGSLKSVAKHKIDDQTEALVELVGDHQVHYRFFIGFKLVLTDQEWRLSSFLAELKSAWQDFIYGVNHQLMSDFVSYPKQDLLRYGKMEKLLESKISRRFNMRKLNKNDLGYLLNYLYGQNAVVYANYHYHLPKQHRKKDTLIKRYDLLKPTYCEIEEKQRYLKLTNEDTNQACYVAYLPMSEVIDGLDSHYSEIFYYQQEQFDFPISTSMNIEIVGNKKALSTVRNKKKELKDQDQHAYQSDNETSTTIVEALDSVDELETDLTGSKEAMYKLSYVVRVTASTEEELKRRCEVVKDFYDDLNIKLVRPLGDMLGLHQEFIPSSKRYLNDYVQYVQSDFLASLGFGATQKIGEETGIYLGYNVDTGQNVYIQPWLAAQGIKGSVTNALSMAFLGSLGGGKSFANNLLVYYAVLFGAQAVVIDPKSERGNWKETLPELADAINIVNLTSEAKNKGMLDPYVILSEVEESESLAIDILTFLTGISSRDGEKFPVLRKAIREVTQSEQRGLLKVIDFLRKENTEVSQNIAEHLNSFTDYAFAQLLFSDGTATSSIHLEKQLNIIQVADLVLPDSQTSFEEYTTKELLSVAMLIIISTFSLEFIHRDRSQFKIVDLDEAWAFLKVAQGKALSNKLVRAGRSMNAGVYFVTQNADDLLDETMKNNIGIKFAFRSTDPVEIKKTLKFFGVDENEEQNQNRLKYLENGQCLFQDLYGRVAVIQIHPVFESLFHAFDTRPPQKEKEVD